MNKGRNSGDHVNLGDAATSLGPTAWTVEMHKVVEAQKYRLVMG